VVNAKSDIITLPPCLFIYLFTHSLVAFAEGEAKRECIIFNPPTSELTIFFYKTRQFLSSHLQVL